jgi:uncharacterized membrane protein (DUF485 family)
MLKKRKTISTVVASTVAVLLYAVSYRMVNQRIFNLYAEIINGNIIVQAVVKFLLILPFILLAIIYVCAAIIEFNSDLKR